MTLALRPGWRRAGPPRTDPSLCGQVGAVVVLVLRKRRAVVASGQARPGFHDPGLKPAYLRLSHIWLGRAVLAAGLMLVGISLACWLLGVAGGGWLVQDAGARPGAGGVRRWLRRMALRKLWLAARRCSSRSVLVSR